MYLLRFVCLLLVLLLSACRSEKIAENVTQYQAHQIISHLNRQGISATTEAAIGAKDRYSISVDSSDRLVAIDLISSTNLLPKPGSDFNELTKAQGFLPNSRAVENLRIDHAIALELEELLGQLPEVSQAKAIVRLNYLEDQQTPMVSLSLVVENKELVDQAQLISVIQKSVPGVSQENIVIMLNSKVSTSSVYEVTGIQKDGTRLVPVSLVPFLFWRVPAGTEKELGMSLLVILILIGIAAYVVGNFLGKNKSSRKTTGSLPDAGLAALRIDQSSGKKDQ